MHTAAGRGRVRSALIGASLPALRARIHSDSAYPVPHAELRVLPEEAVAFKREIDSAFGWASAGGAGTHAASGQTALELLNARPPTAAIVTFCKALDDLLGGGVQLGEVTEFCESAQADGRASAARRWLSEQTPLHAATHSSRPHRPRPQAACRASARRSCACSSRWTRRSHRSWAARAGRRLSIMLPSVSM
jgi:hypothetical protein